MPESWAGANPIDLSAQGLADPVRFAHAGIREPAAVAKLPADEQEACKKL